MNDRQLETEKYNFIWHFTPWKTADIASVVNTCNAVGESEAWGANAIMNYALRLGEPNYFNLDPVCIVYATIFEAMHKTILELIDFDIYHDTELHIDANYSNTSYNISEDDRQALIDALKSENVVLGEPKLLWFLEQLDINQDDLNNENN